MDMNERERKDIMMSTLYDIRLTVDAASKETFTKAEILSLLDAIGQLPAKRKGRQIVAVLR